MQFYIIKDTNKFKISVHIQGSDSLFISMDDTIDLLNFLSKNNGLSPYIRNRMINRLTGYFTTNYDEGFYLKALDVGIITGNQTVINNCIRNYIVFGAIDV